MTLEQLKTYTVGVLKGWFSNKQVLDKLSESEDGNLLYNGNEIVSSSGSGNSDETTEPPTIVGRKLYPILDLTGHENGYAISTITYKTATPMPVTMPLTDSLNNYDAVILRCNHCSGGFYMTSTEVSTDFIKQIYGKGAIVISIGGDWVWFGFKDADNIGVMHNSFSNGLQLLNVYGIKYETVSADPITDAEVTQAVTETVEGLNAEESEDEQ